MQGREPNEAWQLNVGNRHPTLPNYDNKDQEEGVGFTSKCWPSLESDAGKQGNEVKTLAFQNFFSTFNLLMELVVAATSFWWLGVIDLLLGKLFTEKLKTNVFLHPLSFC